MATPSTQAVLRQLWRGAGLPETHLDHARISLPNAAQHVLPSSFRLGCAAQACIAAAALAASLLRSLTEGTAVQVEVDARHAALEFASERYSRLQDPHQDGKAVHASVPAFKEMLGLPLNMPVEWDPLAGYYPCANGRHVRLHTNWKHHKLGLLRILGLSEDANREEVAAALLVWNAERFESAAREAGMCATMCRTPDEWLDTAAARSIKSWLDENGGCPVRVVRAAQTSSSGATQAPSTYRPLRVVDMSRVIAAPVAGRTLAKHGADVLLLSSPRLPNLPMVEIDTARGKRAAAVDLDTEQGKTTLRELVAGADVVLQAYRLGSLAKRGFSLDDLQGLRPGLIYAELNAYGFTGPWKQVRGFDSLVQSACGINSAEADSYQRFLSAERGAGLQPAGPRVLPCHALDHASGHLLAFGILAAKCRSLLDDGAKQSGWHVQVSLAGTAAWLESLGRAHGNEAWRAPAPINAQGSEVRSLLEPYTVRQASKPLTLHAIQHAARHLPDQCAQQRSVPAHLHADLPEWV